MAISISSKLLRNLIELDKKLQDFDELSKDIRILINKIFWDTVDDRRKNQPA